MLGRVEHHLGCRLHPTTKSPSFTAKASPWGAFFTIGAVAMQIWLRDNKLNTLGIAIVDHWRRYLFIRLWRWMAIFIGGAVIRRRETHHPRHDRRIRPRRPRATREIIGDTSLVVDLWGHIDIALIG